MISQITCMAVAALLSLGQLSPPDLHQYDFTPTESKLLPGKTPENRFDGISNEQDRLGPLALVALKYQNGHWTDGRYNHNDFPVEIGKAGVVGQEQRFEAFRLSEPLRKATKFLGSHHAVYYRFPAKSRWNVYRIDSGKVELVTSVTENEISPGQYTRIMGLGGSTVKGSATYFIAPATTHISNYQMIDRNVEAASLGKTPLGELLLYRHGVEGTPPDQRRGESTLTRQFFIIKGSAGPAVIWQDRKTLTIYMTSFSNDLKSSSSTPFATERPGRLLAACNDPSGNIYYLLAREKGDPEILELLKTDPAGKTLLRSVPDSSQAHLNIFSISNHTAASLAWANNRITMMLMRTMYKSADGLNHQGGIATLFDANSLKQIKHYGQTSSHSFGNILTASSDGNFVGIDLGDGYPRGIHLHKFTDKNKISRVIYTFKTGHAKTEKNPAGKSFPPYPEISTPERTFYKWSNDNSVYTELGGLIEIPLGYMAVFTGTTSPEGRVLDNSRFEPDFKDRRNIGLVVVRKDFEKVSSKRNVVPDELLITKGLTETGGFYCFNGNWTEQRTTGVVWLTHYTPEQGHSAYNPKTALLSDGNMLILWKTFRHGKPDTNWATVVTPEGKKLTEPFQLPEYLELNKSDAVMVDGRRVYIASGDKAGKKIELFVLQLK